MRTKNQIIESALAEFGFTSGQDTTLDAQADSAFYEAVRELTSIPFEWSRVRGQEIALTTSQETITLPTNVGLLDNDVLRIRNGDAYSDLMWLNPTDFDSLVSDKTIQGIPCYITSEEFTEVRKVRIFPVPLNGDLKLVISYWRNLEYTASGGQIGDGDLIVAPLAFEEVVVLKIKSRLAPIVHGSDSTKSLADQMRYESKIGTLMKQLPAVQEKLFVRPTGRTSAFDQGM